MHKDLKPQNILVHFPNAESEEEIADLKRNWTTDDKIELKIADFGLAEKVEVSDEDLLRESFLED